MATITVAVLLMVSLMQAEWIAPSSPVTPTFGTPNNQNPCIGSYRNTIFYFQGDTLMQFYINNNSLTMFQGTSPLYAHGYSQYWTQIEHSLFIIYLYQPKIGAFDLSTKTFEENWNDITVPTFTDRSGCLASSNDSLYVVGGGSPNSAVNILQILDLSTNQWRNGSNMIEARNTFACVVSPSNNNLYAIGGQGIAYDKLDTIEYISVIDIQQNEWEYINNKLDESLHAGRVVTYDIYIYYIGGYSPKETVKVIDTSTNTVSTSPDQLAIGTSYSAPIIVNNVIHSFGGVYGKWQYYNLRTLMLSSIEPTLYEISTTSTTDEPKTYEATTDISTTNERTLNLPKSTVSYQLVTAFGVNVTENNQNIPHNKTKRSLAIILIVSSISLLTVIGAIIWHWMRRKNRKIQSVNQKQIEQELQRNPQTMVGVASIKKKEIMNIKEETRGGNKVMNDGIELNSDEFVVGSDSESDDVNGVSSATKKGFVGNVNIEGEIERRGTNQLSEGCRGNINMNDLEDKQQHAMRFEDTIPTTKGADTQGTRKK